MPGMIALVSLLVGCPPPFYGIKRVGHIAAPPELSCVRSLLDRHKDISSLRVEDYGGGRRLTWRGLNPPDSAPTFIYAIAEREYWLQFYIDQDRPVRVSHAARAKWESPVSELLDIQSRLVSIEREIEHECGVPDLVAKLEQTCGGNHCDELGARAAQQGAAADRATARSDRRLVVFGITTWALRSAVGGGPGS